jgi:hypothetical protein
MQTQEFQTKCDLPCRKTSRDPEWQKALPVEWRDATIAPLHFKQYREYEIPASRTLGYDEEGQPCYYRHTYIISSLRSDDDEEFYESIAYGEEVQAWRLRDERWLIWRIVHEDGVCRGNRGFYSFSESMPR